MLISGMFESWRFTRYLKQPWPAACQNLRWKQTLGSEWRHYEQIFPTLNNSKIDQVSLKCANSKVPMSLIGLLKDKVVMVGAIDVSSFAPG